MKAAKVVKVITVGALSVQIRHYSDNRYGFDGRTDSNEQKQVRSRSLEKAVEAAKKMLGAAQAGTLDLLKIKPDDYAEFLRWRAGRRESVNVPDVVAQFLASKETKGRTAKTVRDLRYNLEAFAEDFTGPIHLLRAVGVEAWLEGRNVGPRRWNNIRADIVALIRYARRVGHLPEEKTEVELIEKKTVTTKKETYSVEELKKYIGGMKPDWVPLIVIGAFCGVRPEEICPALDSKKTPLVWEDFLWDKGIIDLKAHTSKVGRRRFIPLNEAAIAFLNPWRDSQGFCVPRMKVNDMTARWGRRIGVPWKFDGWRHSYASNRLAITKNISALEDEMGNSKVMIHDHYLDRKFEQDARAWFGVRPKDIAWRWPASAALYRSPLPRKKYDLVQAA